MTPYDVKSHIKRLLATDFNQLYPDAVNSFKASGSWLIRFLNRHNFSLRRRTKISQRLAEKLCSFHASARYKKNNNFELNCIANMDETPIFDMSV